MEIKNNDVGNNIQSWKVSENFNPDKRVDLKNNKETEIIDVFIPDKGSGLEKIKLDEKRDVLYYKGTESSVFGKDNEERFDPDKRVETENKEKTVNSDVDQNKYPGCSKVETIDGKEYLYDSNGKLFRIGDELVPNNTYELNGYTYKTDEKGRITSVEGQLHEKTHQGKLKIRDSIDTIGRGDQQQGDDRGHLIGDQFGGANGMENMIPQNSEINQKDYRNFENELREHVKNGDEVKVKVEPIYDGDSHRPSDIVVTYSINDVEDVRIFPNQSKKETE